MLSSQPEPPPEPPEPDGFHDPLSTPAEPTLSPDSFNASSTCQPCHAEHYDQWRTSTHAYAMVDPVFQALVAVRQVDYDGAQDQFCTQCHSAIGTRGGEIVPGFSFEDLPEIVMEGIGCEACHKVSAVERPYNSGHQLDPDGPIRGPLTQPTGEANHESTYADLFQSSEFCAGCHDVLEVSGLELERPYQEWLESPAAEEGLSCQGCHMPEIEGPAAVDGPTRTLHDHRFVGVDVPLSDGFATDEEREQIRSRVLELLDGAASLELVSSPLAAAGQQLDLLVTVKNEISGHNLPTGTTFIRELWLEVTATDGAGEVLYETGHLDDNGDLKGHYSDLDPYGDSDLLLFSSTLIDVDGNPVLFPWRAAELRSNAIPPLYSRTFTLFVPTQASTTGPIQVDARLRFRTHAPYLLRALGLHELVEDIQIYDISSDSLSVPIAAP